MARLLKSIRARASLWPCAALAALTLAAASSAHAAMNEFDATIDLRAIASDGERSYLNGGLGLLRFDQDHEGLRVGQFRVGYLGQYANLVHVTVEAVSFADHNRLPIDLTEAFVEVRPFPWYGWRPRLKLGAFYAPISLENRLQGWRSAYSLTPSAVNSWVGEELRTIGAEYDLDWLGRQRGHDWELSAGAAAFGWNDSAGTLMAERGWALTDRQTTLFGWASDLGGGALVPKVRPFYYDIDHRAGYYVDGSARYLDAVELRALHYDNRANSLAYSAGLHDNAWHTWFDSAGLRWTPAFSWTAISQWLEGDTCLAAIFCWQYSAEFLLTSWQAGPNMVSGRYDDFQMHMDSPGFIQGYFQHGHAWTLTYQRELGRAFSLLLEAMQVDSNMPERTDLGLAPGAVERILQLAVRWDLN